MLVDCEQSLFGQSRLSSAGLERANSRERGKRECEASESRGEAGEKAGKEGGIWPHLALSYKKLWFWAYFPFPIESCQLTTEDVGDGFLFLFL